MVEHILKIRTSVIFVKNSQLLGFWGRDPQTKSKMFFLPGGKPDKGESLLECAVREFREETGYIPNLIKESELVSEYDFNWNGILYRCKTHYFIADKITALGNLEVEDAAYHEGVCWEKVEKIDQLLRYSESILNDTRSLIKKWF